MAKYKALTGSAVKELMGEIANEIERHVCKNIQLFEGFSLQFPPGAVSLTPVIALATISYIDVKRFYVFF